LIGLFFIRVLLQTRLSAFDTGLKQYATENVLGRSGIEIRQDTTRQNLKIQL